MKKELKNKIRNAYESETPDLRERVVEACENETQVPASPTPSLAVKRQKRPVFFRLLVAVTSCLILFAAGLFVGKNIPTSQPVVTAETCVYLDVNPSLELSLDEDNTVLSCTAANEDAEIILNGMKLEGVELKTALNAIVGSMYVKGYLSSVDNSILISVDTNDANNTSGFLSYITNQVNEVFADSEMECAIIAQGVKVDEDLKRRAKEQGISVGKMHLLDKMFDIMKNLTEFDIGQLSGMSIKDLNLLYSQNSNAAQKPNDELISGSVNVDIATNDALTAVLTSIHKTVDNVEESHIHILPSKYGEMKVVYAVTLKFYNDAAVYEYEVDCHTGEIRMAFNDLPPNGNPEQSDNGNLDDDQQPVPEEGSEPPPENNSQTLA